MKKQYDSVVSKVSGISFVPYMISQKCLECNQITQYKISDVGTFSLGGLCEYCCGFTYPVATHDLPPVREYYRPTYQELLTLDRSLQKDVLAGELIVKKIS